MGPDLPADDYSSDDAPLRQLEVASVHPTRAAYEWGPTTAQRGVLVYMCTSEPDDVRELMASLGAIQSSFIQTYDYPIAIFHEDYDRALMERVQAAAPLAFIYFVKIRFQLPKHMRPLEAEGVRIVRHVIPNPEHATGFHEHTHGLRPYVKRADKYPYVSHAGRGRGRRGARPGGGGGGALPDRHRHPHPLRQRAHPLSSFLFFLLPGLLQIRISGAAANCGATLR